MLARFLRFETSKAEFEALTARVAATYTRFLNYSSMQGDNEELARGEVQRLLTAGFLHGFSTFAELASVASTRKSSWFAVRGVLVGMSLAAATYAAASRGRSAARALPRAAGSARRV